MWRFRRVLYVERHPKGSGRGLSCALEVARTQGADLTVAAVVEGPDDPLRPHLLQTGAAQRREAARLRCRRRLEALVSRAETDRVPVRIRVLEGSPADAVLEAASRGRHDLVMKVVEDRNPLFPWRLRSIDRRLLRQSSCCLWMLDPAQHAGLRVVLAAVDVTTGRPPELNARIVRIAASVAERAKADLHVMHAWSVVGEPVLASHLTGVSRSRLRNLLASTRRERRRRVEALLAEAAPRCETTLELRKGYATLAVQEVARSTEADVVVLGSSGRDGRWYWLLGNLAERVAGRVPGSVLLVRGGGATGSGGERADREEGDADGTPSEPASRRERTRSASGSAG